MRARVLRPVTLIGAIFTALRWVKNVGKKKSSKKSNLLLRISRVSKSQHRTPNQLGDIASDILAVFFQKNNQAREWNEPAL